MVISLDHNHLRAALRTSLRDRLARRLGIGVSDEQLSDITEALVLALMEAENERHRMEAGHA